VVAGVVAWLLLRDTGPPGGPLSARTRDSVAFGARAGAPFGWGTPVIWNTGDETAVLDRMRLIDASPGLRVLHAYIGGPARDGLFTAQSYHWPDREFTDLHPVAGMSVAPQDQPAGERGAELVFELRADRPGRYTATRIAVDYHVGGTHHRTIIRSGLSVCPNRPPAPIRRDCPLPRL
jgi:hypothetical protein